MELPLYEFEVRCIPDYGVDISDYKSALSKVEISNENDALEYGQYIFDEISDELSISTELSPIAIIRDEASDAWGVSFGVDSSSIGNGYSIAFFSTGDLIAIWPEE